MSAHGRVESLFVRARAGERDAVVAELRAAIAADRGDDEAWLALGLVLADAARWSDAIEPLVRACAAAAAPEIARATLTHAWLMALEAYERAVALPAARAARLLGRSPAAIDASPLVAHLALRRAPASAGARAEARWTSDRALLVAELDAGAVRALFLATHDPDPHAVAAAAIALLDAAFGAAPPAPVAAHLLARIGASAAIELDDLRVEAAARDGAHGLRVTPRA